MIYTYQNPETGEIIDVSQSIHESHEYIDENGMKWNRIFAVPYAAVDSRQKDPFSQKEYMDKTSAKRGNLGNIMDYNRELSERRTQIAGVDPVRENYYKKYSEERNGVKHPDVAKRESQEKLKKMGVKIS